MHYLVLGPLEVRDGSGAPIPIRRGRPRSLLHLLIMHRRVVVPVEVAADRLWEQQTPSDASNAVHQLVSYLRRALGPAGREQLVTSPLGYRLDVADDEVDAWRFDQMMRSATQDLGKGTVDALERAMRTAEDAAVLWRGEPFPESSRYQWSAGDINRLKESYLQLQETRLDAMLCLGRHREVVLEAQSLAAAYPLRERFHAQQALALYRSGRQSEALDALRKLRRLLDEELALDPGHSVQTLEQQILQQDPSLDPPDTDSLPAGRHRDDTPRLSAVSSASQHDANAQAAGFPQPRLPPPPPKLLGRTSDLDQLVDHLRPGALLTLTGLAGIGKSALARHIARTRDHEPVWYVDLSDVDRPELAPAAVARQTGFTGQLPPDPTTVLITGFQDADGLLVVDTCEHVLPSLSRTLERIRQEAPRLTILATSRRPLDLPDETIHRLHPLAVPPPGSTADVEQVQAVPSVQLFVGHASRVRSDFPRDPRTIGDVADIVRTVEGVPLAIELAAANADVMSPATIKERLTHHLDDAASTSSRPGRQASLKAALDASHVLLGEREGRLFDALAAFRGPFGLEAVRAVVDQDVGDPRQPLASLVRQSLVVHDGGPTYRLLRPVRVYAAQRLNERPDRDQILQRHALHVAESSRVASAELRTSRDALTRLHHLLPDARAGMDWALSIGQLDVAADISVAYAWYWNINGLTAEGMRWLHTVLDAIEAENRTQLDASRHGAVLRSLGLLANPMGRVREARDYCLQAIELSSSCGDEVGTTAALLTLGIAEWALGDLDAAAKAHDLALQKALATGERWHRASALTLRARTALDAGEPDVEAMLERAVEAAQDDDERQLLSVSLTLLGHHHLRAERTVTARIAAEHALEAARSIHYREGELSALNLLGRVELATGLIGEATDHFTKALSTASATDHRGALCETLESMALAAAASGRPEHAYLLLRASERERARRGLHLPSFGAATVTELRRTTSAALGAAAEDVDARVNFYKLDELVRDLLAGSRACWPMSTG